jgi:predicted nucleic acid-binding protein
VILYLDTSALVKLFVAEAHCATVRRAVQAAAAVATHLVAYAEACSAFARFARARGEAALLSRLRRQLDECWIDWEIVQVEERLVRRAADFCAHYGLRGYDSVHLAAAESIRGVLGVGADFRFGAFDARLAGAATSLGLTLLQR